MPPADEWDLIKRARDGDRPAFDRLFGPLIEPGFRVAYGLLREKELAEDAVQEATLKAWRKLGNLRDGSHVRPWFFAIVANQARTLRRGRWWSVLKLEGVGDTPVPSADESLVRGFAVRQALGELNHDQRLALVLHFYLDLPLEEVAEITGVPVGTVKSRIHRGVERMRPGLKVEEVFS